MWTRVCKERERERHTDTASLGGPGHLLGKKEKMHKKTLTEHKLTD